MPEQNAFILRIKPSKRDRVPEALATDELIIGWSKAPQLTDLTLTRKQFREIIHQTYHNESTSYREAGMGTSSMWNFIREMAQGDLVVVPHGEDFYVARVNGFAYHDPHKISSDTAHRRPVQWLNKGRPLKRNSVSAALQNALTARLACVRAPHFLLEDVKSLPLDWADLLTPMASDIADPGPAARAQIEIYRILRDTKRSRHLKEIHKHCCQLCGFTIQLPDGRNYAEAHHIQPLGAPHHGSDVEENMLVLCPNHHAMCDFGAMRLSLDELRLHPRHAIGKRFLDYHNSRILKA